MPDNPKTPTPVDVTENNNTPTDPGYQYVDTTIESAEDEDAYFQELYGKQTTYKDYDDLLSALEDDDNVYKANGKKANNASYAKKITDSITGIFELPYQFSDIVDPSIMIEDDSGSIVGRKYGQKSFICYAYIFLNSRRTFIYG